MHLLPQGMMAAPHLSLEAMEVDYDSDATDVTEPITTPEGDVEDEGEEEDGEGSRTPSIHELGSDDLGSPELGRRRRPEVVATTAAAAAALQHQNSGEENQVEDSESPEIGRRRPAASQQADPEEEEEIQVLPHSEAAVAAAAAAAAGVPPQPQEEPQHSPSSSHLFNDPQPSPAPPSPVPPDHLHSQQQSTLPLSNEDPQAGTSGSSREGTSSSTEASDSNQLEVLNPPVVAGPSTQVAPISTTPKRNTTDAAPAQTSAESEDEGQICPICFEPWSNMGDHRLASLKCGHLFGFECVTKWLQANRMKGRCPQCNAKASRKDIRVIYAKSIKVLDTTEKERILKELQKEREEKRRLEVEHAQTKLKYELKHQLVVKLQEELKMLKNLTKGVGHPGMPSSQGGESSSLTKRLVYREWLEVCRDGGCRVMAHNEWLGMLVVSMPSQVGMFPGYGVKKINLLDMRVDHYVPLHQRQIRDLAFNPAKHDLLLSVGMDRLVKITNICSNASVAHFTAPAPVWCCCWSTTESNVFFVGTASGGIQQYDTRNTSGPVATIQLPGSGPAVSMTYIHPGLESSLTWDGLLVARLQSCFFVETGMSGEAKSHQLPLDGTFTSVSCEANTCHVLVSCRPSQRHPHARHVVCLLQQVNTPSEGGGGSIRTVTAQPVHTFQGGTTQKVLTRSLLACPPQPGSCPLVYASDESTQSIYVWNLNSMTCLQQLRHSETVVDLVQVTIGQTPHLAALSEKGVKLYRWTDQQ